MWHLDRLADSLSYLDSNVLIYAFEGPASDLRRRRLATLFERLEQARAHACASVLVRAEVLVGPLRSGNAPLAEWYGRLLSGRGPIRVAVVSPAIADGAAGLRAERPSLRLPDALHLAAAIRVGCDYFITGDRRLARLQLEDLHILDINELSEDD